MPETVESYILKLNERNRHRQKSHHSRLDSKKNIGKRTGKVITSVGGIADISGLFDSSESADFEISRASITNSIQSKNSAFVKRTPKPLSPPQFSSDEEVAEDEIANTSHQAQQNSDSNSDENNDDLFSNNTNIQNRSIKIGTDVGSQSLFKSYVNQSTQYSSPRRPREQKSTAHSHDDETSFRNFSENEIRASQHRSFKRYGGHRSSAGESDYASSPSKLESKRIFERILSARKSTSKSTASPYDTHIQKDLLTPHTHSEAKNRSNDKSNLKNIPTGSKTNSEILKQYTEMITSAKKASKSGENESLSNASLANNTGLLTPRQLSRQSNLRRRLSFKERQIEAASKPVVTLDTNEDVSAVHPLFELDNHSTRSVSDVVVNTMDSSQAAPGWLYHSTNIKEHHPSLLKRRSSSTKKLQGEKSTSRDLSQGRSRSSAAGGRGHSSSRSKSNRKSNSSSRTEHSSKFKSKQKLVYDNDSNENTNRTTSAKKPRGRSSSKKQLNFIPRIESSYIERETSESREQSQHKSLSTKKARRLPLKVVAYSSSDESDDVQTKATSKKRTPLKSLQNEDSTRRTSKSRLDSGSDNEKLHENRRKSLRKSHKFYESLMESDILHKMESAERLRHESMYRIKATESHKKNKKSDASPSILERRRNKIVPTDSDAEPKVEKIAKKKSINKSRILHYDADLDDYTDHAPKTRPKKQNSFHIESGFSEREKIDNHTHSSGRKVERSRIYSDSSNSEDEFISEDISKELSLKRKKAVMHLNEKSDENNEPSPPKRKRKDIDDRPLRESINLKNKKTHEAGYGASLQSWLDSGIRKEKTPVRLPGKTFKSPNVMHSTRIEERHKKVPSKQLNTEESYIDHSQLPDHPPLPRVNESSINYTSDDLGRVVQGKSRYSMGFGPPASTPHGLKRTKKRIDDKSSRKRDIDDTVIHPEGNDNEDEAGIVRINSFSNDSRESNETYTVRKKRRTKRKSTKPISGRKSLKYPNQANDEPSNTVFDDGEMLYEDVDPISDVEPHMSRTQSPSKTVEASQTEKKKVGRKNDPNNSTKKSLRDSSRVEEKKKRKPGRPKKNTLQNDNTAKSTRGSSENEERRLTRSASKSNTTIKTTEGATREEEDNTLVASDHDGTLTEKGKTSPKKLKKVDTRKKKSTSAGETATEKKKATPKKRKKNSYKQNIIKVVPKTCLALDIVIPNAEVGNGLRRSRRIRTRPLGYRERFVYDDHHKNIIGIERNGDVIPIDVAKDTGKVVHIEPSMDITISTEKIVHKKKKVKPKDTKSRKTKPKPETKKKEDDETQTNTVIADQQLDTQLEDVSRPQMEWFDNISETAGAQSSSITSRGETSRQNTRNITVNTSLQSSINRTIPIVDCSTDSVVQVGLTSLFCHDEGLFGTPEVPVFSDEGVYVTKGLSYKGVSQGKLLIRPLQQKCERVVNNAHMCFNLHQGTVDVTLADHTLNVPEGTYFRIPSKNRYSIYNPHKTTPAILFFTMIRIPKTKQGL